MALLTGKIIDKKTGELLPSRVQVIDSGGEFVRPDKSLVKVGPGESFFYSDGNFELEIGRGSARILVERGTEYIPAVVNCDIPVNGSQAVDITLDRWFELSTRGWHPGNTHIHYDEKETRPDERLQLDPRVEDLRMTAVSILQRWDLEYATNKYSPGVLTEFTSSHHYVECGEENRHNKGKGHDNSTLGYGHIMLLNIQNVVHPVSRGLLVDAFDPDYPPLSYACDDAHRQGGIVIWCHNGQGMEAPVAAVLGKVDAFNLFDPRWMDPEYDIYYKMLNAGIHLPASTGSDWFISSANRVYCNSGGVFKYEDWINALRKGKTFITNGPSIEMAVNDYELGDTIETDVGKSLNVKVQWKSFYPLSYIQIICNGKVIKTSKSPSVLKEGVFETDIKVTADSLIAARVFSTERDSFLQPIFAHTSPIYVTCGISSPEKKAAADWFVSNITESLEWVSKKGKFYTDKQRREVIDIFRNGQNEYKQISEGRK